MRTRIAPFLAPAVLLSLVAPRLAAEEAAETKEYVVVVAGHFC